MIRPLLCCLLFLSGCLYGQVTDPGPFTAISARMLLIDHDLPNEELTDLQKSYAIELGLRRQLRKELGILLPVRFGNVDVGDFTNKRFAAIELVARVTPLGTERAISPYLQAGYGYTTESGGTSFAQLPLGLGVDLRLGEDMWFNLQLEYRSTKEHNRDQVVAGIGYVYRFGQPDRDGDRIPDGKDKCPDVPGLNTASGCPDADRDGVADEDDDCPDQAGTIEAKGCPDYDKDGIPDHRDQCPYEAGSKRLRGCPDIDNDGVPDDIDQCPNTPGSLYSGCPDTDNDGFEDRNDDCPDVAGPNRGCPEVTPDIQARLERATNEITFDTRSDKLTPASLKVLDDIVAILQAQPSFRLTIAGHTDNTGTDENNQKLSELRALSCRGYLMSKGIDGTRIRTLGYGASRPRADNDTTVGRDLNRRVEFALTPQ